MTGSAERGSSRLSRILRSPGAALARLAGVFGDALQRFFSDGCKQYAASIAYRVLFSIAPLAIVLVSVFGLVLQNESVRQDVIDSVVGWLPVDAAGSADVADAITEIATPASAVGLVSLLVFAWAATGMMAAIRLGLEAAMGVTEPRPMARGKLVDLLLVVGAAALVLLSATLTLLGTFVAHAADRLTGDAGIAGTTLASGLLRLETFGLSILVVMLLYRFVPARGLHLRDGLVGAIVTAVLLQLISFASDLIYERTTQLSVLYGSLTAALVFLYSIYLYSCALLFGAEIAAAWSRPAGGAEAVPIRTQVKRGVLGLFVRQEQPEPRPDDDRSSN